MDELMAAIQEKTGLPAEQASVPRRQRWTSSPRSCRRVSAKLEDIIAGNADVIAGATEGVTDKIKGMFSS